MDFAIILAILIVPTMAQLMISKNYNKGNNQINENNVSGMEVAHTILEKNDLEDMYVVEIPGTLTDHYDVNRKVIRLSRKVFNDNTISSLVVSAQECAHAIMDATGDKLYSFREVVNPIIKLITILSYILILGGAVANMLDIFYIGIGLISISLLFELFTLPVEFKANKMAMEQLKRVKLVDKDEVPVVERLLRVISFRYVASILTSVMDLLRYISSLITDRR